MEINKIYVKNVVIGYVLNEREIFEGDVHSDTTLKVGEYDSEGNVYDNNGNLVCTISGNQSFCSAKVGNDTVCTALPNKTVKSKLGYEICRSDYLNGYSLVAAATLLFNIANGDSFTLKNVKMQQKIDEQVEIIKEQKPITCQTIPQPTNKNDKKEELNKPAIESKKRLKFCNIFSSDYKVWFARLKFLPEILLVIALISSVILSVVLPCIYKFPDYIEEGYIYCGFADTWFGCFIVLLFSFIIGSLISYFIAKCLLSPVILNTESRMSVAKNTEKINDSLNKK
ncbi:MAG: hypothetical protein J6B04_06860 [Clostridia bacterium]|nr:hypothetical protein [Clostridia bacterium]